MKKSNRSVDFIFYGGPASGKSTQAVIIATRLKADILNMGAVLRKLATGKSKIARQVAVVIQAGKLVPADITAQIVREFIKQARDKRIIFDGFPRNVAQAKMFDQIMKTFNREIRFVSFDLTKAQAMARIKSRVKLEARQDDSDAKALKNRFTIFGEESKKLKVYFKDRLIKVPGQGTKSEVTKQTVKLLKPYL